MRHHTIDVETTGTLQRLALFEGLSEGELAQVARLMTEVAVPAGKVLCREGSYGRQCFILVEGEVTVARGGVEISRRGPGDLIGELALAAGQPVGEGGFGERGELAAFGLVPQQDPAVFPGGPREAPRHRPLLGTGCQR